MKKSKVHFEVPGKGYQACYTSATDPKLTKVPAEVDRPRELSTNQAELLDDIEKSMGLFIRDHIMFPPQEGDPQARLTPKGQKLLRDPRFKGLWTEFLQMWEQARKIFDSNKV